MKQSELNANIQKIKRQVVLERNEFGFFLRANTNTLLS